MMRLGAAGTGHERRCRVDCGVAGGGGELVAPPRAEEVACERLSIAPGERMKEPAEGELFGPGRVLGVGVGVGVGVLVAVLVALFFVRALVCSGVGLDHGSALLGVGLNRHFANKCIAVDWRQGFRSKFISGLAIYNMD